MEQWIENLKAIDTLQNHQKTLDRVLEAFLTSDYANCKHQRTKTVILFNQLKKLSKVKQFTVSE